MAVYVDNLMARIPSREWPFRFSCHLIADSVMELHNFARKLGLRLEWYQCHSIIPHYDLSPKKRAFALRIGALEISRQEMHKRFLAAKKAKEDPSL
jgi:hypothetical protein